MSRCVTCTCTKPTTAPRLGTVLLATRVAHSVPTLASAVREAGGVCVERDTGLLEVSGPDLAGLLAAACAALSPVEAAEVRAVSTDGVPADRMLAAAMTAPTLAQLAARARHADLLPLFADELRCFRSVYQPIVALDDEGVVGYEALLRASGPDGPVMPAGLFGAAQEAGWLHVLDRVGRTSALRGAADWLGDALLFVNFLPTTIYRPQVCLRTTERAADAAGLRLDQLVFEVTESERVTDLRHLADVFTYYRERGCKVALDDLGAGWSSLNMLVELQPDVVKLDKTIVQRLPEAASRAVVTAVVDITHAYGGLVLAECVESADQAAAARDLGVDLGQGWHFGRPQEQTSLRSAAAARLHRTAGELPQTGQDGDSALDVGTGAAGAALSFPGNDSAVAVRAPVARPDAAAAAAVVVPRGLADVEALLARAVDLSSAGVTITDATALDMPLIYVNAAFEQATGYRAAEVLGRNCRFLQGPGTDPAVLARIREAVREGREHVAVVRNYRKDGQEWWNELRLSPIRQAGGRVTHYFGYQTDVTARVEAEREVTRLAHHDLLTELPNRRSLLTALQQAVQDSQRDDRRLAVLFIDLDGFKAVNDTHGHGVGDLVLTAAAACLRGALRAGDLLARYSGDEFVALLPDVPPDLVQKVAQRSADAILGSLSTPLHVGGTRVQLGASVGVALLPDHGSTAEQLLQAADRGMYAAKAAGRGRAALAPRR